MFKGLGNLGNLASMMGSLKDVPEKMRQLNERMKNETVTASSACEGVVVTMNGVGHLRSIRIRETLAGAELENAVVDATNAAGAAAKQMYADAVSQMASDMNLNLPGMDGILSSLTGS